MAGRETHLYRYNCTTEAEYITEWRETAPTECVRDSGHTIDTNSITIIDTISENVTYVSELPGDTTGYLKEEGYDWSITSGVDVVTECEVIHKYVTRIYNLYIKPTAENVGDYISAYTAPDTTIGAITSDVSSGTVIDVSATVLTNINLGFTVSLVDASNGTTQNLGECWNIDTTNSQITVDNTITETFTAAGPTYVQISIPRIQNLKLVNTETIAIGAGKIGGSQIPANIIARIVYTNKDGAAKTFSVHGEIEY